MSLPEFTHYFSETASSTLEIFGIAIISLMAIHSTALAATDVIKRVDGSELFRKFRRKLGRGILIGLEFLVAADIVRTVVVLTSFSTAGLQKIGILIVIILIRTFLSFTMDLEMTGHWPWQGRPEVRDDTLKNP